MQTTNRVHGLRGLWLRRSIFTWFSIEKPSATPDVKNSFFFLNLMLSFCFWACTCQRNCQTSGYLWILYSSERVQLLKYSDAVISVTKNHMYCVNKGQVLAIQVALYFSTHRAYWSLFLHNIYFLSLINSEGLFGFRAYDVAIILTCHPMQRL